MGEIKKADSYHTPVLFSESLNFLITDPDGLYIDGTLGGGGHSAGILGRLGKWGHLIAYDKDPEAVERCTKRFDDELRRSPSRLEIRHQGFEKACSIRGLDRKDNRINGILLDLGVSSRQLDSETRGISYRIESNLDMRFSGSGKSARDILHESDEEELVRIFKAFAEEPFARPLARRLVERRAFSLEKTSDIVSVVESVVPPHIQKKSLSRVFQAIRIAVNDELNVLTNTLSNVLPNLAPGGRCVVISYHSLEDRIVKNIFRQFAPLSEHKNKYAKDNVIPDYTILTKKPVLPSKEEITENKRARSAKLRVIQKNK
jgi:16S rRNA (cytosine1402-N4)-methyltransferase